MKRLIPLSMLIASIVFGDTYYISEHTYFSNIRDSTKSDSENIIGELHPKIPAGKRLMIENISVYFFAPSTIQPICYLNWGGAEMHYLPTLSSAGTTVVGNVTYAKRVLSQRVSIPIESSGAILVVNCARVDSKDLGPMQMNATIVGRLEKLN